MQEEMAKNERKWNANSYDIQQSAIKSRRLIRHWLRGNKQMEPRSHKLRLAAGVQKPQMKTSFFLFFNYGN